MAELQRAVGVNPELVEALVKKHFGPAYTSKVAWNFIKGRYVASTLPRRIAAPQKVFGFQIGWKVIGEFSDNLGFRLDLWDPSSVKPRAWPKNTTRRLTGRSWNSTPSSRTDPPAGPSGCGPLFPAREYLLFPDPRVAVLPAFVHPPVKFAPNR